MLLYSDAHTAREHASFSLDVDIKLLCNFQHVSKLTARKNEGVIDAIEYYMEDEHQERRTWGPFCTIEYNADIDAAGPGVYFFLVNAKIAYIDCCSNVASRLSDYATIPKSLCNVTAHQPICRVNTRLYRAFQRRDLVHCFYYPLEEGRLVRDILIDIVRPAWNVEA